MIHRKNRQTSRMRQPRRTTWAGGFALALLLWALPLLAARGADLGKVDYNFQIRPLLSDRCFKCHGPDESARKKKLRLDTREGLFKALDADLTVVKPGDPGKSELVRRILTPDEDDLMPPPKSGLKLSAAEKDLLQRWVAEGAEYKSHWSLIPVRPVTPPKPTGAQGLRNPIDSFVLFRLDAEKLSPVPEAARETLLRRLALDLTGLPPTLPELDAFLADPAPQAYENAVERYLTSPAYGERMAVDWLDLARYADTYGYQADVERDLAPWRDWVVRAFNENLGYDKFLSWQLAGDLLPHPTRDQRLATAFNRLHRQTNEGGSIEEEFRAEYVSDRVNTLGTAMLGLTLGCARCHDHKYDPVKQRDYYALYAFFNSIDESGIYSHFTRATPTPTLLLWPESQAAEACALKTKIAAAEAQVETLRRDAGKPFRAWLKADGKVLAPQPVARFAFDTITNNTTPDSLSTNVAKLEDGPKLVSGAPNPVSASFKQDRQLAEAGLGAPTNFALQFSGDNQVACKEVGNFTRPDSFSFSLWLQPTERQDRAVVLHHSRAWTDSGSRGYELVLDHGQPFFALIHFWPGNAIAVRANRALPTNEWSHLVVAYDGSSRAAGIRLYLNGAPLETEIVRDHLYKDIMHRAEWGDSEVGSIPLTLAGRFRDSGFKNGMIDELQVFDLCLTAPEIKLLAGGTKSPLTLTLSPSAGEREQQAAAASSTPASAQSPAANSHQDRRTIPPLPFGSGEGRGEGTPAFAYFLARHHEPYRTALAELKKLREQENTLINGLPEIMTMQEMPQPRPTFVLKRGAYDAPGDPVERDTPASISPFPADAPRNRLGLAQWMVDRRNPLPARVAVNRVWKMHFGRGIVATLDDFGSQGKLPTHPELLDWLAGWFMDHGWDVKALHRLIVTSATFRQSSQTSREVMERDPDNLLLARGPKQRLSAEAIRDAALAASGLLNRTIGGPSVKPYQPAGLWEAAGTGKSYSQDHGDKLYRRSLYTFWRRTAPPPSMLTFDALTREVCTAKRETTTTPLQALVLLNDPQFVEAARALSERLLKDFPNDPDARTRAAFRSLTGRSPDEKERAVLRQLFEEQKRFYASETAAAEKLLATGESKPDAALPRPEFAATTMLVSAIMNFDEFVMER